MASSYKLIPSNKFTTVRNIVNESIPITGSLTSGTYTADGNIQNFSHGMFQSVFDYPYLSASANKLFDITCGFSANSTFSASTNETASRSTKINIYNEMAKVLMGYDITGSILEFDEDGNIAAGGTKLRECVFISFSRLLQKDEIKKGTFVLELYPSGTFLQRGVASVSTLKFTDIHATSSYFTNSPAGEWSYLVTMTSSNANPTTEKRGLIFYQAGIVVLTASIFGSTTGFFSESAGQGSQTISQAMTGAAISGTCDGFRRKLHNISFLNATEVNSTVVFLDIGHDEFNYSSNPTYLSSSKIRVKTNADDLPVTYITTVGLYSADNELLAVGKYSEPIRKTPADNYVLKARLDFIFYFAILGYWMMAFFGNSPIL